MHSIMTKLKQRLPYYLARFILEKPSIFYQGLHIYQVLCNSLYSFKWFLNRNITSIPKYYYIWDRKSEILHTRLRLQCSSLNADLLKNHTLDNDKCPCGQVETAEHFLLYCPLFTELRNDTIMPYNIEILLKGCPLYSDNVNGEIFLGVQNFILKSKRFE